MRNESSRLLVRIRFFFIAKKLGEDCDEVCGKINRSAASASALAGSSSRAVLDVHVGDSFCVIQAEGTTAFWTDDFGISDARAWWTIFGSRGSGTCFRAIRGCGVWLSAEMHGGLFFEDCLCL